MRDDITWADLELVLSILRGKSLSDAARRLKVRQSTVSRRLQELEERLGAPLFLRTRDGAIPTALGESWRAPAERAEWGVLEARRVSSEQLDDGISGQVKIASLQIIAEHILLPALPPLLNRHPGLEIALLSSGDLADLMRLEADIAIRLVRPTQSELIMKQVRGGLVGAYASADLKRRIDHLPLTQWPWLGWTEPRYEPPPLRALFESHEITPRLTFSSAMSQLRAARLGLGIILLSDVLARCFPEMRLLDTSGLISFESPLWVVTHERQRHVPRVNAVWEWLGELSAQEDMKHGRAISLVGQ